MVFWGWEGDGTVPLAGGGVGVLAQPERLCSPEACLWPSVAQRVASIHSGWSISSNRPIMTCKCHLQVR
jgi:hypothetical protein